MIRRELGIDRYQPSEGEVERVKEEFGLYRGGLQYKPPPEEVDMIVRACPVMVNGEGTERIEVAGYREFLISRVQESDRGSSLLLRRVCASKHQRSRNTRTGWGWRDGTSSMSWPQRGKTRIKQNRKQSKGKSNPTLDTWGT